ncbi:Os02g0774700 [Oryza sativa Japonica Group]|uniref:Uncharacterized protein n=2 Tax=Oryza sativa subsp. japonica TaxID=39947 RepID=A0A8J8YM36_ORYSJ|nr:hypothetical protein OsJ_08567 [Oryza sativa Japonica Group]BAS81155.1 Os02g0774700 [Oryza sativa Japonica Group]
MHEWAGYPLRSRRWSVEAPEPGQLIYNDSCNEVMSVGGVWHPSAVGEPQAVPVLSRPPSQPCCPMPRLEHGKDRRLLHHHHRTCQRRGRRRRTSGGDPRPRRPAGTEAARATGGAQARAQQWSSASPPHRPVRPRCIRAGRRVRSPEQIHIHIVTEY